MHAKVANVVETVVGYIRYSTRKMPLCSLGEVRIEREEPSERGHWPRSQVRVAVVPLRERGGDEGGDEEDETEEDEWAGRADDKFMVEGDGSEAVERQHLWDGVGE
jgi:hypothetical protein